MRKLTVLLIASIILGGCNARQSITVKPAKINMDKRTEELQELRFGMFVCWSFSSFSGYEWTWGVKDVSFFNPTGFDPDQWCKVAKDSGMGYILFLTKHHDGFCLWDTKTTDRKVTNSPLGADVLAKLSKACRKHGLKLALYFSEGEFAWDDGGTFNDAGGCGFYKNGKNPHLKKAQLNELLTQYGPIEYIWFDHALGDGGLSHSETMKLCKSLQPGCFIGFNHGDQAQADIRLGELGRPGALDDHKAAGKYMKDKPSDGYRLAEFTYPILTGRKRGAIWFYSLPENDRLCHSAEKIYQDYLGAEKYGNIFSLNVGPDRNGRIRDIDVKTLKKIGQYICGEIKLPKPIATTDT